MEGDNLDAELIEKFKPVSPQSTHWPEKSEINDGKYVHKFQHHNLSPRVIVPVEDNINVDTSPDSKVKVIEQVESTVCLEASVVLSQNVVDVVSVQISPSLDHQEDQRKWREDACDEDCNVCCNQAEVIT